MSVGELKRYYDGRSLRRILFCTENQAWDEVENPLKANLAFTSMLMACKWCIANRVNGACDGMLHIENVGLSKVRTQMVANPTQLQMYLDVICEPESEQTTDNIYRCFYWMAYSGMGEEAILNAKCSDVDFENMVIHSGDEEFEIYREAIPAFKNAATLTEFVYKHPNYPPDKKVIRNRAPGNTLIRGIRSTTTVAALRVELSRRSKKFLEDGSTDKQLSYYRVWLSGLFFRMNQRERAGIPVDFSGEASKFMEGKTYKVYIAFQLAYYIVQRVWETQCILGSTVIQGNIVTAAEQFVITLLALAVNVLKTAI